jgi:hypothetical protein
LIMIRYYKIWEVKKYLYNFKIVIFNINYKKKKYLK